MSTRITGPDPESGITNHTPAEATCDQCGKTEDFFMGSWCYYPHHWKRHREYTKDTVNPNARYPKISGEWIFCCERCLEDFRAKHGFEPEKSLDDFLKQPRKHPRRI